MNTPGGYIDTYLGHRVKQRRMTRRSAIDARYTLMTFADIHGDRPIHHLGASTVDRWLESIAHLSPATRRNYLSRVRMFCKWLVDNGKIKRNPCDNLEPIRQPRAVSRSIDAYDIARLLAVLPDLRAEAIVWLMVGCALRCCEVARMGVQDYDRRRRIVTVTGKGGHERIVPVPDEVARVLDRYMSTERITSGPLIRNRVRLSRGVTATTLSIYVRRWMIEAGVKSHSWDGTSAHALRHTCATDVYTKSRDLRTVQQMLGHANAAVTSRYIGVTDLETVRTAMSGRNYSAAHAPPSEQPKAA